MDILKQLKDEKENQVGLWHKFSGILISDYSELTDAVGKAVSDWGVEKAINSNETFDADFCQVLIDSIEETTSELNNITTYGRATCKGMMTLFAPTGKDCASDMQECFSNCQQMLIMDNSIDMHNVRNMVETFLNCYNLIKLPDSCTFENAINMQSCMSGCYSLRTVPTGFNPIRTTSLYGAFNGCKMLTRMPDIPSASCLYFGRIFYQCVSLTEIGTIDMSSVFNSQYASNSTSSSIYQMFYGSQLTHVGFTGSNNVTFDCRFNTDGWQNLDVESICSFVDNVLGDVSEDENVHIFQVTPAMQQQLDATEWDEGLSYTDYIALLGWSLQ